MAASNKNGREWLDIGRREEDRPLWLVDGSWVRHRVVLSGSDLMATAEWIYRLASGWSVEIVDDCGQVLDAEPAIM